MRKVVSFLIIVTFIGCNGKKKNQLKIEENATLSFQEAYYQDRVSGVKGGGSGINIFLVRNESDFEEIEIKGIFFHEKYTTLKTYGSNKHQGFIKGNANNEDIEEVMVGEEKKKIETIEENFPFDLQANEAVISFLDEGVLKYNKITLVKKKLSLDQIPR
tara:strand:+ start:56769 stop:57248 length:480 start_codon:yes stop_codon:yes gene_type:complete